VSDGPEFVVVGAGVMGAATARALARAGREVALLEQLEIGHSRGSSHGRSRVFRLSYADPMYVAMAQEALPLWRELEDETGRDILETTGEVDIGEAALANHEALESMGAACERLSPEEAGERFPMFAFPPSKPVVYQPDSGITLADGAVRAFVDSAVGHGAELRERTRVVSLHPRGDRVEVETGGGALACRVAVATAGAWVRPLLASAGIDLPVEPSRETAAYFRLDGPMRVVVDWDLSPLFYALPDPGRGIKAAQHHAGPVAYPDEVGEVSEEAIARLSAWVGERIPAADPEPWSAETCLYTNTDDERFILERHGPLVVGSACSGHGFKFAPLIGKRLAELALS